MYRLILNIALFFLVLPVFSQENPSKQRQTQYLDKLLPILRPPRDNAPPVTLKDKTWLEWQQRTGELPPDFATMPSIPFLPDPLVLHEGTDDIPVETREQWEQKRQWIKDETQHWVTGTFPEAPDHLTFDLINEHTEVS